MLNKFIFFGLQLIVCFLLNSPAHTNEYYPVVSNSTQDVTDEINRIFTNNPNTKNVIWRPLVNGRSLYSFNIPKKAFSISKKSKDTSALFYMVRKKKRELIFHSPNVKNIDILSNGENFRFDMHVSSFSNMSYGIYTKKDDNNSFGITLKKDFMVLNEDLFNLKLDQPIKEYPTFNAQLITLINDEKSQISYDINHKFKSDALNGGIKATWFEVLNDYNLNLGVKKNNNQIFNEFYLSTVKKNIEIQFGFTEIDKISKPNIFFDVKFNNIFKGKSIKANVILNSKRNLIHYNSVSLEHLRERNLDKIWRENMNFKD